MKVVHVSAPARIHFGLLSLDRRSGLQFGGAGVMVDRPRIELEIAAASRTQACGPHADRVLRFIEAWRTYTNISSDVSCTIRSAPQQHVGLGLGTQLGLAVASALDALHDRIQIPIANVAASVQRGQRSAVGSYGFREGGLIVELGKRPGARLSDDWERIQLPDAWRLLLIRPAEESGLAGSAEARAFEQMPPVSEEHGSLLRKTLLQRLVPAARAGDFVEFGEGVYLYGKQAGACFAPCQTGAFRSALIADIVQRLRGLGVRGVGQSSWGPTIFCWCESPLEAERRAREFRHEFSQLQAELTIAGVDRGARVTSR
jgi:beta-RFAP synthase